MDSTPEGMPMGVRPLSLISQGEQDEGASPRPAALWQSLWSH